MLLYTSNDEIFPCGVSLSKRQLEKLLRAYNNNSAITIRLTRNELSGPLELMLTKTQIKKSNKPGYRVGYQNIKNTNQKSY